MRKFGKSYSRTWGTYKGGVAPVLDATPVWQSPEANSVNPGQGNLNFSLTLAATSPMGRTLTYSVLSGVLPPGLSLSADGVISGVPVNPSQDTSYPFTIRASDGTYFADRTFSIRVSFSQAQDPYNPYVVGLYHLDNSLADSSNNALTMTTAMTAGFGLTAEDSKFGGYSLKCGSGYAAIPVSSKLQMSDDFTIEFWLKTYATQTQYSVISSQGSSTVAGQNFEIVNYFGANGSTSGGTTSGAYFPPGRIYSTALTNDGQWHHHAIVRSGNTWMYFVDGVMGVGTLTGTGVVDFGSVSSMRWGGNTANSGTSVLKSYLDEIRITNGAARYTANFTPPSAPFGYP